MLIDTHSHFYSKEFNDDLNDCIKRCKDNGVQQVLMPNVDVESIERMHLLEDANADFFKSMMGVHPCYVKEDYQKLIENYEWIKSAKFLCDWRNWNGFTLG